MIEMTHLYQLSYKPHRVVRVYDYMGESSRFRGHQPEWSGVCVLTGAAVFIFNANTVSARFKVQLKNKDQNQALNLTTETGK